MRKTLPRFPLVVLAATSLLVSAMADTVVLKSGEKIEGKVTSETATEVTIETKSGGIIDQRTVPKTDVQSVSKPEPDQEAWAPLSALKLGNNSFPSETQYDNYLTPLKSFVRQFPNSKNKAAAEKIMAEFEAEQKRVTGGEVKLNGTWLSKEAVQRERYQINGTIAFNYLRDQAARGDSIGALNTFDLLEKQYPGSRGYLDGVETVRRILPPLKQQVDARLAKLPAETAEREKSINGAAGLNKVELKREYDQEKAAAAAALAQSKAQKLKWPPLLLRNEDALRIISELTKQDAQRLAEFDLAKARKSFQHSDQARAALDKKDVTAADDAIRLAREAWGNNEVIQRLDKQLAEVKAAASAPVTPAVAETADVKAAATKSAPESETSTATAEATAAEPETEEGNPLFRIVLTVILAIVLFAGWKIYSGIQKKANEVIE